MKKITAIILTALVLVGTVFSLASCKNEPAKNIEIDIDALAKELSEKVKFESPIKMPDDKVTSATIGKYLTGAKKTVYYSSDGATPEMIVVAEYEDEAAAKSGVSSLEQLVKAKKDVFDSYNTQYRSLLDDIILESDGKYAILCVSSDTSAAKTVVAGYTK